MHPKGDFWLVYEENALSIPNKETNFRNIERVRPKKNRSKDQPQQTTSADSTLKSDSFTLRELRKVKSLGPIEK